MKKNILQDRYKRFNRNLQKLFSPQKTFLIARQRMKHIVPPLLKTYQLIKSSTGIPCTRFWGTERFKNVVGNPGTNGKGPTKHQACASGIMEMVERFSCFSHVFRSSTRKWLFCKAHELPSSSYCLEEIYGSCMDPRRLRLLSKRELTDAYFMWYPFYSLMGKRRWIPLSFLLYFVKGTNGMASGNCLEEAIMQGACELLERHCETLIVQHKLTTPIIPLYSLTDGMIRRLVERIQRNGRKIWVRDFSLGFEIPVIGVVCRISPSQLHVTTGVATSKKEAIVRALTENAQTDNERNWIKREDYLVNETKIIDFSRISDIVHFNLRVELQRLQHICAQRNMRIYYYETTHPDLKIPSVIVHINGTKYSLPDIMGAKFRAKKDVWQSDISALITTYITHQKFELATRYIIKGLKRDQDNEAFYRYKQGYIYMCMQEYNKARVAFEMYRDIMPLSDKYNLTGSCLALSGICHVMRDEYDKAVDFFIMAIPYLKCGQFPYYPEPQKKKYQEARSLFFRLYRTVHFNNAVCLREL